MNTSGVIYVVSFQRCGLPQLGNWLIVCSMLGDNVFCSDTVAYASKQCLLFWYPHSCCRWLDELVILWLAVLCEHVPGSNSVLLRRLVHLLTFWSNNDCLQKQNSSDNSLEQDAWHMMLFGQRSYYVCSVFFDVTCCVYANLLHISVMCHRQILCLWVVSVLCHMYSEIVPFIRWTHKNIT